MKFSVNKERRVSSCYSHMKLHPNSGKGINMKEKLTTNKMPSFHVKYSIESLLLPLL